MTREVPGDLLTIEELIARAEFEPTLKDIYVEGPRDAEVVRLVLVEAGVDASVYPITDRLDVRRADTEVHAVDYGNRAMLVAAAIQVDAALGAGGHALSFIIDSDYAIVIGPQVVGATSLLMTDGPSLEHYFYESPSFQQVLSLGLGRWEYSAEEVRSKLQGALRDVASARLVLLDLNVPCIPKIAALCDFSAAESSANAHEIVRRSLSAVSRSQEYAGLNLSNQISTYRTWISEEQYAGRGHDIAPLLAAMLKLTGEFAKVSVLEAMMRASVALRELLAQPLFLNLVQRCSM